MSFRDFFGVAVVSSSDAHLKDGSCRELPPHMRKALQDLQPHQPQIENTRHSQIIDKRASQCLVTLRVQVPNNHILTPNLYYNHYYPKPKYLTIVYMDPLGKLPETLVSEDLEGGRGNEIEAACLAL